MFTKLLGTLSKTLSNHSMEKSIVKIIWTRSRSINYLHFRQLQTGENYKQAFVILANV
ncbi:hypothetical protein HYC85_004874 [Camellia sinensis]|uniref:Uncharacterized protein n=1 Tax=Camellia sinensis TaxID=4442 RepID=A0A7J7HYC2_CAMSI|nr:hypothetical protein HYC85_004874 [Camellia sinensis]